MQKHPCFLPRLRPLSSEEENRSNGLLASNAEELWYWISCSLEVLATFCTGEYFVSSPPCLIHFSSFLWLISLLLYFSIEIVRAFLIQDTGYLLQPWISLYLSLSLTLSFYLWCWKLDHSHSQNSSTCLQKYWLWLSCRMERDTQTFFRAYQTVHFSERTTIWATECLSAVTPR